MTRDDFIRLALDAHLLNYVDLETPRRYFIPADAGVEEVEQFAALVAAEKDKEIARLREENVYLKEVYEDLVQDRKELFDDLDKAVAAEREACAKICDGWASYGVPAVAAAAQAIRARGEQEQPR